MSVRESISSLRIQLADRRAERARRRELEALLDDPALSPSSRQEMNAILAHAQSELAVPAQRTASTSGPLRSEVAVSR